MTMTPRQRWLATLTGDTPDRIATDIWATPEVFAKLQAHLGREDRAAVIDALNIDAIHTIGPRYVGPELPPHTDYWGVTSRKVDYGSGEYTETDASPLASATSIADVERYTWPDPDWFDHSTVPAQIDANAGRRIVRGGAYEPFLLYCRLRGMEQAYIDLLAEPAVAEAILTHIFDFFYEHNRRILEAGEGRIDMFYLAEDLGAQTGQLFSLETYRRFLMPNQQRMADLARGAGTRVFYHTDGSARDFLPDLVHNVGIDILNPLQWRCPGMQLAPLVRDFAEHIAFHGGIDNQHTLPFGSVSDVRKEVCEVAAIMKDARWICAPCHNIQPVTPPENVVAMYETIATIAPR